MNATEKKKQLQRLLAVSDEERIAAIDAMVRHLVFRFSYEDHPCNLQKDGKGFIRLIGGRTYWGAHSESNLGDNAFNHYIGEALCKIYDDWTWKEDLSFTEQLIVIIDSLISHEVEKFKHPEKYQSSEDDDDECDDTNNDEAQTDEDHTHQKELDDTHDTNDVPQTDEDHTHQEEQDDAHDMNEVQQTALSSLTPTPGKLVQPYVETPTYLEESLTEERFRQLSVVAKGDSELETYIQTVVTCSSTKPMRTRAELTQAVCKMMGVTTTDVYNMNKRLKRKLYENKK